MAYQTYTTEAIVVGSFASKTADKTFLLFTRDAGMVYASARSVREERSRQRYALQDFSLISVSLIKGKTGWRIGSVEVLRNYFLESTARVVRASVYKQIRLVRRYVQGEEVNAPFYEEVKAQLDTLASPTLFNRPAVEQAVHTRLLYALGYISLTPELSEFIDVPLVDILPKLTATTTAHMAMAITQADDASHL